jgi:hypothetical protein
MASPAAARRLPPRRFRSPCSQLAQELIGSTGVARAAPAAQELTPLGCGPRGRPTNHVGGAPGQAAGGGRAQSEALGGPSDHGAGPVVGAAPSPRNCGGRPTTGRCEPLESAPAPGAASPPAAAVAPAPRQPRPRPRRRKRPRPGVAAAASAAAPPVSSVVGPRAPSGAELGERGRVRRRLRLRASRASRSRPRRRSASSLAASRSGSGTRAGNDRGPRRPRAAPSARVGGGWGGSDHGAGSRGSPGPRRKPRRDGTRGSPESPGPGRPQEQQRNAPPQVKTGDPAAPLRRRRPTPRPRFSTTAAPPAPQLRHGHACHDPLAIGSRALPS